MKNLQCKNKQELMKVNQSKQLKKLDTTELREIVGGRIRGVTGD